MKASKIIFFTRNDALKHVIINNIVQQFESFLDVEVVDFKSFLSLRRKGCKNAKCVYHDDPIAMFLYFLFGYKTYTIFHSLEMYEYQVRINNPKRIFRFLIFKVLHGFALRKSDMVIFANELRRSFYLEKYKWLDKGKTRVLENIPFSLDRSVVDEFQEQLVVEEFVSKFEATLIITGAIGEGRDINKIVHAFNNQKKFGLCIVTQSSSPLADSESVLAFRNLEHGKVLALYKYFNAGLLFYDNEPLNVKLCAPTKMYEYLSFGLYLIGNNNSSLKNNGYVDYFFDQPEDIFSALNVISKLPVKEALDFNSEQVFNDVFTDFLLSLDE